LRASVGICDVLERRDPQLLAGELTRIIAAAQAAHERRQLRPRAPHLRRQHHQRAFRGIALYEPAPRVIGEDGIAAEQSPRHQELHGVVVRGDRRIEGAGGCVPRTADFAHPSRNEHAADRHLALGQRSSFVGADHRRRSQRLDGREPPNHCATRRHAAYADGERNRDDRGKTFRDRAHGESDRDLIGIIRTGIPGTAMAPSAYTDSELSAIVAYLRNMNAFDAAAVKTGDSARGRALFTGKGACTGCHRAGADGSIVGPNLSDVGATRSAGSLQRSLLDPVSQMMPINRPVRAVTKDGTIINGRRLNEDTYSLQIIDDRERLHSLLKVDLREYAISTTSPMPSYKGTLSDEEIADVMAYLLSVKGQ